MVSLWPWRSTDSSPASFEKTLSTLSAKIATTQSQLEKARSTSRRMRVLWTLYLGFAYSVYAVVLTLVVGWKNMGAMECTGIAGGPVLIYVVRATMAAFFNYRIDTLSARLKDQQEERAKTIQKLKDATKYDSTLELLEKYGGSENKPKKSKKKAEEEDGEKKQAPAQGRTPNRTNLPPPPTANIQRRPFSSPSTPQSALRSQFNTPQQQQPLPPFVSEMEPSAEFAPNAGATVYPQYPPGPLAPVESHWYDRILDTLLGEDETASKNRIVLICKQCRLVNGQAPPGTKSLAELGTWKCMACQAVNGEMDEGKRIMREVLGEQAGRNNAPAASETTDDDVGGESSDLVEVEKEPSESEQEEEQQPRRRKGRKKN